VLEELDTGAILGTAAVYPDVGHPFGFFSYRRAREVRHATSIESRASLELLYPCNDYTGATEVGTLAVLPSLRGTGAGRLLAQSRYLLIASFPELFGEIIMAEMRGWQDAPGQSPFWTAVGRTFFGMEFEYADLLSATRGSEFIADLLPRQPIYVDLLPREAREAIGRPHMSSAPALALLRQEGFRHERLVDIFDAGPQVHAHRSDIRTIAASRPAEVASIPARNTINVLAARRRLEDFCVFKCVATGEDGLIEPSFDWRQRLSIDDGEELHFILGSQATSDAVRLRQPEAEQATE
jgi:arginine N-succinyltransferase